MTDSSHCARYPEGCSDCSLVQCQAHPDHDIPPKLYDEEERKRRMREQHFHWQRQDLIKEIQAATEEAELKSLRRQWRRMRDLQELRATLPELRILARPEFAVLPQGDDDDQEV